MRYYYTDPLAAAWMIKHHGVHFDNGDNLRSACEAIGIDGENVSKGGAFYVHPDSMGVFEPREGDVLFPRGEKGCGIIVADSQTMLEMAKLMPREWYKIIQRNGKAFIWPEVE